MSLHRPCRSFLCRRLLPFSFFSCSRKSRDDDAVGAVGERESRVDIKIEKQNLSPIKLGDNISTVQCSSFRQPRLSIWTSQVLMLEISDRDETRRNKLQAPPD